MRCNPKLGPPAVSLCQHYFSWFLRDHKPLDLGIENFESFPFWFEFCALWSENISFGFFHYTLFFSFLLIKILFVFIIIICILSSSNFYFVLCRHHYVQGQDAFQIYLRSVTSSSPSCAPKANCWLYPQFQSCQCSFCWTAFKFITSALTVCNSSFAPVAELTMLK